MIDNLEGIWKEAIVTKWRYYSTIFLGAGGWGRAQNISAVVSIFWARFSQAI